VFFFFFDIHEHEFIWETGYNHKYRHKIIQGMHVHRTTKERKGASLSKNRPENLLLSKIGLPLKVVCVSGVLEVDVRACSG